MKRRDFIKNIGIGSGVILLPTGILVSCSKEEENPFNPPQPEEYIPDVDDIPYKSLKYFNQEQVSGAGGSIHFTQDLESITLLDLANGNGLSGIDGSRHRDRKFNESSFFFHDSNLQYLPTFAFNENSKNSKEWPFVHLRNLIHALTQGGDVFVDTVDEYLPSWSWEHIDDKPGMVYFGDWKINEINNFLELSSEVASICVGLFVPGASAKFYSILSSIGDKQSLFNKGINVVNHFFPGTFDLDKEYALFSSDPSGMRYIFIYGKALSDELKNREVNVKDLLPLNPGSWWNYKIGSSLYKAKINFEYEDVNGKNLVKLVTETGLEEFLGFRNENLRYFGFNDSSVGRIFFKNPSVIGDDVVKVGKKYSVKDSKVICENYPEISGTIDETYEYLTRENLIINGVPYGACFKVLESFNISLKNENTGATSSESSSATHWYCKNVGKVKSDYGNFSLELDDYYIQGSEVYKKSSEILNEFKNTNESFEIPTKEKTIVNLINRLK